MQKEKQRITLIAILLVGCFLLTYYFHALFESGTVFTHFFYIPIIMASLWWKRKGLAVAIFLAALLLFGHHFLRGYVTTSDDYFRAAMFVAIGFVVAVLSERIANAEEKAAHLNSVLRAIRNVNQLIAREKNRDSLVKGVCESLIETRGYHSAWIAILDENGELVTTTEAGLGKDFLPMIERLKRGELTDCGQKALKQSDVVVTKDLSFTCGDCPLVDKYDGREAITIRLEYDEKVYGLLCASIPADFTGEEEKQSLFKEVAGDIAFALHIIGLEEELVRKEKLAILGLLAGGVGHELRNPLGVISNAIYYLKTILPDADETTREYLGIISSEVGNADKIVTDLLDFSRTRPAEREEIAVSELITQVLEKQFSPLNIEVTTQISPNLPPIFVDPRQITQVLTNIVSNAFQAMTSSSSVETPDGGELTISAELPEGGTVQNPKSEIRIRISDTGCGISKENMKKLFEPLFTTRARGIGLGLSVSKNLVESNRGSIEVESPSTALGTGEEGKGSTFTIILPIKEVAS